MTHISEDLLAETLHRELGERASEVTSRPELAGAVIARARAVRRRRTLSACASAVVVTAAIVLAATALAPRAATPIDGSRPAHTPTATLSAVPSLAAIPYALNTDEIHLNGRTTHLPAGWTLRQMVQAG